MSVRDHGTRDRCAGSRVDDRDDAGSREAVSAPAREDLERAARDVEAADQFGRSDCDERLTGRRTWSPHLGTLRYEPHVDRLSSRARLRCLTGDAPLILAARDSDTLPTGRQNWGTRHTNTTAGARGYTAGFGQRQAGQLRHLTATVPQAAHGVGRHRVLRRSTPARHDRQPERSHDHSCKRRMRAATPGKAPPYKHAAIVAALTSARLPATSAAGMREGQLRHTRAPYADGLLGLRQLVCVGRGLQRGSSEA